MAKGRGFASMRSCSMDGSYNRINPTKDLYSINESHAADLPSSAFGYERVGKPAISRRSSFSWARRAPRKRVDADGLDINSTFDAPPQPQPQTQTRTRTQHSKHQQMEKEEKKKKSGIKGFFNGILDSYKKIMQSAEEVDMQLGDLYPGNAMVAPVTPAASTRSIKYISPSPGVGRTSLGRLAEESERER